MSWSEKKKGRFAAQSCGITALPTAQHAASLAMPDREIDLVVEVR
jgi:hypothetical protein